MANISAQTLVVAIQAVEAERRNLESARETAEGSEAADLDELLFGIDRAASELKEAYTISRLEYDNLPPYSQLVKP